MVEALPEPWEVQAGDHQIGGWEDQQGSESKQKGVGMQLRAKALVQSPVPQNKQTNKQEYIRNQHFKVLLCLVV